jgi:hypothetical protein
MAEHHGSLPAGNDGLAIAHTLASPSVSLIATNRLHNYGASNPPAKHHWTWDMTRQETVESGSCAAD